MMHDFARAGRSKAAPRPSFRISAESPSPSDPKPIRRSNWRRVRCSTDEHSAGRYLIVEPLVNDFRWPTTNGAFLRRWSKFKPVHEWVHGFAKYTAVDRSGPESSYWQHQCRDCDKAWLSHIFNLMDVRQALLPSDWFHRSPAPSSYLRQPASQTSHEANGHVLHWC